MIYSASELYDDFSVDYLILFIILLDDVFTPESSPPPSVSSIPNPKNEGGSAYLHPDYELGHFRSDSQ